MFKDRSIDRIVNDFAALKAAVAAQGPSAALDRRAVGLMDDLAYSVGHSNGDAEKMLEIIADFRAASGLLGAH